MQDATPTDPPEPPHLRKLRVLVTVLMWVMIVGMVTVVGLLALRLSQPAAPPLPDLPARISLPAGARVQAVTAGPGWYAVVTEGGRVLVYDAASGALRREVVIDTAGE